MEWFWILQGAVNLTLCAFIVYLMRSRKNVFDQEAQAKAQACLTVLETRVEEMDGKIRRVGKEAEDRLRTLRAVCDKVETLAENAQIPSITLSSSEEQKELLSVRHKAVKVSEIPSVKDVERQQGKIGVESAVDLKSLLNEQLA